MLLLCTVQQKQVQNLARVKIMEQETKSAVNLMARFLSAKKCFCDPVGINVYEFGLPTYPLLHQNGSFTNENLLLRTDADSAEHCSAVLSTAFCALLCAPIPDPTPEK